MAQERSVFILTNSDHLFSVNAQMVMRGSGRGLCEAYLPLKLKRSLGEQNFVEQQQVLESSARAAFSSLNPTCQSGTYSSRVSLNSVTNSEAFFAPGSTSSGLGYSFCLFLHWWRTSLGRNVAFEVPVFATGEIIPSGAVLGIDHANQKLKAVVRYLDSLDSPPETFFVFAPRGNERDVDESTLEALRSRGGEIEFISSLSEGLGCVIGSDYDGLRGASWSPFKGLRSFELEDSLRFFGREQEVSKLVSDIELSTGVLLVSGASGSGKSSIVKSGVFARLRSGNPDFLHDVHTPTQLLDLDIGALANLWEGPSDLGVGFEAKASAIFCLDQAEEIFSFSSDQQSVALEKLKCLINYADDSNTFRVIVVTRSEYLHLFLECDFFSTPIIHSISGRLHQQQWESIVTKQARFSGIEFERDNSGRGLDQEIIEEAMRRGPALAHVEFLLDNLYKKSRSRGSKVLTFQDYRELGGLNGAIASRANEIASSVSQDTLEEFFEQFVGLGQSANAVCQSVNTKFLTGLDKKVNELFHALSDAQLVTALADSEAVHHEEFVRLTHDSLLSEWTSLQEWFTRSKDYLRWRSIVQLHFVRWQEAKPNEKNKFLLKDQPLIAEGKAFEKRKSLKDKNLKRYLDLSAGALKRKRVVSAVSALLVLLVVSGAYYLENIYVSSRYYADILNIRGLPVGVNELDRTQIEGRQFVYHLQSQGGKLIRMTIEDSLGRLTPWEPYAQRAITEYRYDEFGALIGFTEKSHEGVSRALNTVTQEHEGLRLAKMVIPTALAGFLAIEGEEAIAKSALLFEKLTFYSDGRLESRRFVDAYGTPTKNKDGYHGFVFKYGENSEITAVTLLDVDLTHSDSISYNDHVLGQPNSIEITEKSINSLSANISYDVAGNIASFQTVNEPSLTSNSTAGLNASYEYNANGQPFAFHAGASDGSSAAIYRWLYGDEEKVIAEKLEFSFAGEVKEEFARTYTYNRFGALQTQKECQAKGPSGHKQCIITRFTRDSKGSVREASYWKDNKRVQGDFFHRAELEYDEVGRLVQLKLYDSNNNFMTKSNSQQPSTRLVYDDAGRQIRGIAIDQDGNPLEDEKGVAEVKITYDSLENVKSYANYGADGGAVHSKDSPHIVSFEYDAFGRMVSKSFFDEELKPAEDSSHLHKELFVRSSDPFEKQILSSKYFDSKLRPISFRVVDPFCSLDTQNEQKTVLINSKPKGTRVYSLGKFLGETPMSLNIGDSDVSVLTLAKDGYQDSVGVIYGPHEDERIEFALLPNSHELSSSDGNNLLSIALSDYLSGNISSDVYGSFLEDQLRSDRSAKAEYLMAIFVLDAETNFETSYESIELLTSSAEKGYFPALLRLGALAENPIYDQTNVLERFLRSAVNFSSRQKIEYAGRLLSSLTNLGCKYSVISVKLQYFLEPESLRKRTLYALSLAYAGKIKEAERELLHIVETASDNDLLDFVYLSLANFYGILGGLDYKKAYEYHFKLLLLAQTEEEKRVHIRSLVSHKRLGYGTEFPSKTNMTDEEVFQELVLEFQVGNSNASPSSSSFSERFVSSMVKSDFYTAVRFISNHELILGRYALKPSVYYYSEF